MSEPPVGLCRWRAPAGVMLVHAVLGHAVLAPAALAQVGTARSGPAQAGPAGIGPLDLVSNGESVLPPSTLLADFPWVTYFAVVAGMAITIAVVRAWWSMRSQSTPADTAFDAFAHDLGLDRRSRWIVRRLADRAGLATPAVLLLSPQLLAGAARSHGPKSGPDRERLARLITLVRERGADRAAERP